MAFKINKFFCNYIIYIFYQFFFCMICSQGFTCMLFFMGFQVKNWLKMGYLVQITKTRFLGSWATGN